MPPPEHPKSADLLVVGIAVVDAVAQPLDSFPGPGGLRLFDRLTFTTGGNAVNCSIALSRLGVAADVVARVGADPLGDFVIAELERHGVPTGNIRRDPERSTSFSFVCVRTGGERSFLHTKGANATLEAGDVPPTLLPGKRFVFVTGTMLMDALDGPPTAGLLREAHLAGALTILDTVYVEGLSTEEWRRRVLPALPVVDYFVPSEAEARAITGDTGPSEMAAYFRREGARNVVIKLGERGVLCVGESGLESHIPACRVPSVVDATGAGDCWSAGFLMGLREGKPMEEAARLGNAVAGVCVQGAGATTALRDVGQVMELIRG